MKIKAEYQGTTCRYKRAEKNIQVKCEGNERIIHNYVANDIVGVSPLYHHYTFGNVGDDISGGFYIKVGREIPDEIELHNPSITVTLKQNDLILEV